jgi:dipeptidyl-peptidase-4
MKKTFILAVSISLIFCSPVISQKKLLTLEDASGMNSAILPRTMRNLQWCSDKDGFTFIDNNALVAGRAGSLQRDTILRLTDINSQLQDLGTEALKRFPGITWLDNSNFFFTAAERIFSFNTEKKTLKQDNQYPKEAENVETDKNNLDVAFTIGNNLFIAVNGNQLQVTSDTNKDIVNGQRVHRDEFGIYKGTFWSPEGNHLAFYRMDQTMVTDYPLVDIEPRIAQVDNIKYPMAGMTSHQVKLGVYTLESGKTVFMDTGEPADQYLTCVTWDPSEKYIYIALLNRDQNHLKLNKYDARTGEFVKTLFEEKNEKYVEPKHSLYFLHSVPDLFIWFSERDGYQHLYLYDNDGKLLRQLTSGEWVVTDLLGTDPQDRKVYFQGTKDGPLNQEVYSVEINSGAIQKISSKSGVHYSILNTNGKYFIDICSDTTSSLEYTLFTTKGKADQVIRAADNPLKDYDLGKMSISSLKTADGTELFYRLILPPGLDSARKYPVIIYVYGGPHSQLITNSWLGGAGLFLNYLAQKGYIVFTLDNRGSSNRGISFEQAIFRNLGGIEVDDQTLGVKYLKSLPYVDSTRIGVHGWSYGGFMTISMMLKHPDDFKVGVSGGPVCDWKYYEVMFGERYMDTPETNPRGYEEASLLTYSSKLKGDLLIIHGTMDPTVVWQNSLVLLKKFISEGIQVDYFVYPGHEHGVGGNDRLHLNRKIEKYFNDHL